MEQQWQEPSFLLEGEISELLASSIPAKEETGSKVRLVNSPGSITSSGQDCGCIKARVLGGGHVEGGRLSSSACEPQSPVQRGRLQLFRGYLQLVTP